MALMMKDKTEDILDKVITILLLFHKCCSFQGSWKPLFLKIEQLLYDILSNKPTCVFML